MPSDCRHLIHESRSKSMDLFRTAEEYGMAIALPFHLDLHSCSVSDTWFPLQHPIDQVAET